MSNFLRGSAVCQTSVETMDGVQTALDFAPFFVLPFAIESASRGRGREKEKRNFSRSVFVFFFYYKGARNLLFSVFGG